MGKLTVPSGGVGFNFTDDILGPSHSFALNDGDIAIFYELQSEVSHTVTEENPAVTGYALVDIVCDGVFEVPPTIDITNRTVTYMQGPGEAGVCIFINEKQGRIVVDKVTDPVGDAQSFDFTLTGGPESISQSFALTDATAPYESGERLGPEFRGLR